MTLNKDKKNYYMVVISIVVIILFLWLNKITFKNCEGKNMNNTELEFMSTRGGHCWPMVVDNIQRNSTQIVVPFGSVVIMMVSVVKVLTLNDKMNWWSLKQKLTHVKKILLIIRFWRNWILWKRIALIILRVYRNNTISWYLVWRVKELI